MNFSDRNLNYDRSHRNREHDDTADTFYLFIAKVTVLQTSKFYALIRLLNQSKKIKKSIPCLFKTEDISPNEATGAIKGHDVLMHFSPALPCRHSVILYSYIGLLKSLLCFELEEARDRMPFLMKGMSQTRHYQFERGQ